MSHDDEAFVHLLYRVLLGREPDRFGYAAHLRRLRTGGATYEELALGILASPEFKQRAPWSNETAAGLDEVISWLIKSKRENRRRAVASAVTQQHPKNGKVGLADPDPILSDCVFYHTMELPDGQVIPGFWDLRGRFDEYVGDIPLRGKTVLDVGTATGFLAFEAEKRGALVTAFDIDSGSYQVTVPFAGSPHEDREDFIREANQNLQGLHNSFRYCHTRLNSKVRMIHGSFNDLVKIGESFDIVFAGALLEHLSDPVTAVGILAKLTRETLIIAATPIIMSDEIFMRPCVSWDDPRVDFSWYEMSVGMYRRILINVGFRIHSIHFARLFYAVDNVITERPSLVAQRVT